MKRKRHTEEDKREKRVQREETPSIEATDSPDETVDSRVEGGESTSGDRSSPFIVGPLSYMTAARNIIMRFLASLRNEQRTVERRARAAQEGTPETENTDNTEDTGEERSNAIAQARAREALLPIIYEIQAITLDAIRPGRVDQAEREAGSSEDASGFSEMDLFLGDINAQGHSQSQSQSQGQGTDQPGAYSIRNIILTITYYIDDTAQRHKTICAEELEKGVPQTEAEEGEGECPICLVGIEKGEIIRKLQCMHVYHCECVSEWLTKYSNECPMCRKEALVPSVDENRK